MDRHLTIAARFTVFLLLVLLFVLLGIGINARTPRTLEPSEQEFTAEMATETMNTLID